MRFERPPEPRALGSWGPELTEELRTHFRPGTGGPPTTTQRPTPHLTKTGTPAAFYPVLESSEIRDPLLEMTGGACAYCGTPLPPEHIVVTQHRPPRDAMDAAGAVSAPHYWWLTYAWDNLLVACTDCVRAKGTRFPVAGDRAPEGGPVDAESPLLLDPCVDDLADHLVLAADGMVAGTTARGRTAIDVLALNRTTLVERRRVLGADRAGRGVLGIPIVGDQIGHLPPIAQMPQPPTAGWDLGAAPATGAPAPGGSAGEGLPPIAPPGGVGEPLPAMTAPRPGYDLNLKMSPREAARYYGTTKWIERVVIRDFRPIRHLDLDFSSSTSEHGPWTVLLGENGSGKSSVLHAIALTLIGGEYRRALGVDPGSFLRHGSRSGHVAVYLSGDPDPLELRWAEGDTEFTGPEAARVLLLGYGATRLLRHGTAAGRAPEPGVARVDNLFDPFLPMTDPTQWLLSLDEALFAEVAEGLEGLLALEETAEIVADRDRGDVQIRQCDYRASLDELSDGYQSMLVLACDVLRTVLTMWDRVQLAEGIVLIDELGAHLHPRWRMRIVAALRTLMPRVQFVVTTHDPLCLRGLLDGEVIVVRRNSEADVVAITDLPPVAGMRVDQLLTSEHFGLGSTDDPEVDDLWAAYYELKGVPHPTADQSARLEAVRTRLDELQLLGTSERDRLLLASADAFIAQRRQVGDAVGRTSADVTAELESLWSAHLPGRSS